MRKTIKTVAFVLSLIMIISSFGIVSVFADNAPATRTSTTEVLYFDGYDASTEVVWSGDNREKQGTTASGTSLIAVAGTVYEKYNAGDHYLRVNKDSLRGWGISFIAPDSVKTDSNRVMSIRYKVVGADEDHCGTDKGFSTQDFQSGKRGISFTGDIVNDTWTVVTVNLTTATYSTGGRFAPLFTKDCRARINLPELNDGAYYVFDYVSFGWAPTADEYAAEAEVFYDKYKVVNNDGIIFAGAQANGTGSVRFVGTVDNYLNENYDEFGFVLTANGVAAKQDARVTKVYKSIVADNTVITPEIFNSANKAGCTFFTFCINGMTEDCTFTVSVYAVINVERVVGQSYTYQYNHATGTVAVA